MQGCGIYGSPYGELTASRLVIDRARTSWVRSQIKNRAECMKMLKSRLYDLEIKKQKDVLPKSMK